MTEQEYNKFLPDDKKMSEVADGKYMYGTRGTYKGVGCTIFSRGEGEKLHIETDDQMNKHVDYKEVQLDLPQKKSFMTFSKFCASGFYGKGNCRCKRCCEEEDKPYNEVEEHKDWVYSRVMKGESFIVDKVKPPVVFGDDGKPDFRKEFKYYYTGKVYTP